jgi:hypothetical protein
MKYKHLFWAIILIALGVLFILNNLGVLHFSWYQFLYLWPLILVIWGIAILPVRDAVKLIMVAGVFVITVLFINSAPSHPSWASRFHRSGPFSWEWDDEEDESDTRANTVNQNLVVPLDSLATHGSLDLDATAGTFTFSGEAKDFLEFSKTGDVGNYEMTTSEGTGRKDITLHLNGKGSSHHFKKNHVEIKLNPKPSWNLNLDIGAASMEMDLSNYKIDTADFDAGASSINLKLGDKNPVSVFTFNAGASSIHLSVPKSAGCQVSSESFLISKTFDGFKKKEGEKGNIYETDNFARATSKIYITVKTAVSSIEIERY